MAIAGGGTLARAYNGGSAGRETARKATSRTFSVSIGPWVVVIVFGSETGPDGGMDNLTVVRN